MIYDRIDSYKFSDIEYFTFKYGDYSLDPEKKWLKTSFANSFSFSSSSFFQGVKRKRKITRYRDYLQRITTNNIIKLGWFERSS